MKILPSCARLPITVLVCGCGLVKIPGISRISEEEAQKKLYMAENYIELGAYEKAEKELSGFPKNSKYRPEAEALLSTLNDFKVQPDDDKSND
jgi:thioredoxin-like negative regulator of GroEL